MQNKQADLHGLTQAEISRRFEIPLGTLAHWEKGDRTPPVWAEKLLIDAINRINENKIKIGGTQPPVFLSYLLYNPQRYSRTMARKSL